MALMELLCDSVYDGSRLSECAHFLRKGNKHSESFEISDTKEAATLDISWSKKNRRSRER